jgi:CheY-like chemotaxis protein
MRVLHPRTVLVVDDYEDVRALVGEILAGAGHDVLEAADGQRALELARAVDLDLAILDLSMPGMDGWETASRIRAFSAVPVLFLSACVEEGVRRQTERFGAAGFMAKPFGRRELLGAVAAICDAPANGASSRVA